MRIPLRRRSCIDHLRPGVRVRYLLREREAIWDWIGTVTEFPVADSPSLAGVRFDAIRYDATGFENPMPPHDAYCPAMLFACHPACPGR
jgi:hypothetical protein